MKINIPKASLKPAIPAGVYTARCSGSATVFEVNHSACKAKSETCGVRGMNLLDTVTVSSDGSMRSKLLGVVTLVER